MDIVAAARAQMLGQLIDAIGRPALAQGAPAQGLSTTLTAGQTLMAKVVGTLPDGQLALRIGGKSVVADTRGQPLPPDARQPGATLRLTVEAGGPSPRLTLSGTEPPPPGFSRAPATDAAGPVPIIRLSAPAAAAGSVPPLQAALKDAVAAAAARQGSAAPLYANLAAVAHRPDAALPESVRLIAGSLLDGRIDTTRPITPDALRQALAMATGAADAPIDVRTLLATLKALLPKATDAAQHRAETPPEPPRRDAAPISQRPVMATLGAEADARTISATLHRDAEQALERAKLQTYAALPEARANAPADTSRPPPLLAEIPLAFGQQTAMLGLKVERDRRRRRDDGMPVDSWGIRFAIETDEIGAVHAHLKLQGRTLDVSLWADEAGTHGAFVAALPLLEAALRDAALDVGELAVFNGRPRDTTKPSAGHFVDVSS